MSIEVTLHTPAKKNSYPKLMISDDETIVLFTDPKTGSVVSPSKKVAEYSIGHYSNSWDVDCFKDYDKQVILHNKHQ